MQRRCHTIMTPRPRKRDRFRELFSSSPSRLPDTNSTSQPGLTHSTCSMPGPPISGSTLSSSQNRHPSTLPQPSPDQIAVPVAQSASPPLPAGGQQVQLIDSTPISAQRTGSPVQPSYSASGSPIRDLWEEALRCLSENDRASALKHISPGPTDATSMLEALLQTAKDKRKICEDKRWNFQFKGHTVRLRDTADKVIVWLDKFKEAGDIAVNADPMHAGLPWAGIRLLLQV
jgi:hypothetical protein